MRTPKRSALAIAAVCVAVPAIVVGGGLVLSQAMATPPPTCASMTEEVDDSGPASEVIIEVVANSEAAAAEAAEFVRQQVDVGSPETTQLLQVTILVGNTRQEASDDGCLGRVLAIAAGTADRRAFANASPQKQENLADTLLAQKRTRVELVAESVREAVLDADDPGDDHGAFYLWNLIAQAAPEAEVAALASPTVSSRNCIQTDQPLLPADDGRTTIDVLVEECVDIGQIDIVRARNVTVEQPGSIGLDELQRSAGVDVIEALCAHALDVSATCTPAA